VQVFVDLIQQVCFPAVSADVIVTIFEDFFGGAINPNGAVDYIEFIDWLSSSLEATGGALSATAQGVAKAKTPSRETSSAKCLRPANQSAGQCNLFMSNQQTREAKIRRDQWLEKEPDTIKVSLPPFNAQKGVPLPAKSVEYNVATFGVRLPQVIMSLFESDDLRALSVELQIPIPRYALDSFVQKKMPKVMDLVRRAREMNLDSASQNAVARVEHFVKEFEVLKVENLTGSADWKQFIDKHVNAGWEDHLHFDSLLTMIFGFDEGIALQLRQHQITVTEKDKETSVSLEHHALRWLSKAFKGYGPVGCLTDVVNLVYAIMNLQPPLEANEQAVISVVANFQDHLRRKDLAGLWIPTHMVHDAESDDALSWLLLEHLNRLQGKKLEVLIQLPDDTNQDGISAFLESRADSERVQVFRDSESNNGKAVSSTWNHFLKVGA
jgi:hypothetical protein